MALMDGGGEILFQPVDELSFVRGVEFFPLEDGVRSPLESDDIAAVLGFLCFGLEVEGLLEGDGLVGITLHDEEGGESGFEMIDGRDLAEDFAGFVGELFGAIEQVLQGGAQSATDGKILLV